MADASNLQTDFRGGEWSQSAQGRMDDKEYHRGLNVCLNSYPTEEGAWNRRSGTRFLAYTLNGQAAWLVPFNFSQGAPYVMEFTDSILRFFNNTVLVSTNDPQPCTVSTANPAVVTTSAVHGWNTGDQVQFLFSQGADTHLAGPVMNRQFVITVLTGTTFSISDPVTSATIDGSTFTVPFGTNVARVLALTSPYTITQIENQSINKVQAELLTANGVLQGAVVLLSPDVAPQVVTNTTPESGAAFAGFSIGAITFTDGPYFDPAPSGTLTPSGLSGSITLSGAPTNTFASTDVGRMIRLFSEPAYWASGTGYTTGNVVKYTDGNYYTASAASTGKAPNTNPTLWAINTTAAVWVWGLITAFTSSTQVTFAVNAAQALLYTTPIVTWRLGLYSNTTGWPACGVFHEGRLWLAGAQGNRFDASMSNQPFNFSPTAVDGTVADNNAISYVFNSDDVNPIVWMTPDHQGIVAGTAAGEWLIAASNLSDPLTPTSIQAKRVSRYKCANVPPAHLGMALMFVQAQQRRLLEASIEYFSGKFICHNISEKARHLTGSGIAQLASQQDLSPVVWVRMNDGTLAGMSYRRDSSFSSEPPTFCGWHRHTLGSNRLVEALVTGPSSNGALEAVTLVTNDPTTNIRFVEMMTDMFDETTPATQPFFVDTAFVPNAALEIAASNTLQLWGGYYLVGKTVSVSIGGLDVGDFVVAADGSVTVPLNGASTTFPAQAALTDAFLTSFVGSPQGPLEVPVNQDILVTYPSTSQPYAQVYKDQSVVTGTRDSHDACNDWVNDEFYLFSAGNASANGIDVFHRYSGARKRSVTATALFAGTSYQPASNYILDPFAFSPASGSIFWTSGLSNYDVLRKLPGSTLAFPKKGASEYSYGKQSGGSGPWPTPTSLAVGAVWAAEKRVGKKWLFAFKEYLAGSAPAIAPHNIITVLKVGDKYDPSIQWRNTFSVTEDQAYVVAGEQFVNDKFSYMNMYALGRPTAAHYPSTAALGVYKIHFPANSDQRDKSGNFSFMTFNRVGSITPANIDATWTHFTVVSEPIFDGSDGNIMFFVQTADSVTNKQYLVKVSTVTAAVLWATVMPNIPSTTGSLSKTYCGSGTIGFLLNSTVKIVTTSTGAVLFSQTLTNIQNNTGQLSDDRDGQIFTEGGFTAGSSSPTGLNSSPSVTNDWMRLGDGNWGPATINTVGASIPQVPMAIGYTFTSQGQRLRPVSPEESGARNGPGFAKTRRTQKAGFQILNGTAISVGTGFSTMWTLELKSDRVNINPIQNLFTGVTRTDKGLDDSYTFDSMVAWQITRPWPCTITAVGSFIHAQDI